MNLVGMKGVRTSEIWAAGPHQAVSNGFVSHAGYGRSVEVETVAGPKRRCGCDGVRDDIYNRYRYVSWFEALYLRLCSSQLLMFQEASAYCNTLQGVSSL